MSGWLKLQLQRAGGRTARPLRSCALARQLPNRTMGKSRRKYAESECAPQQPFNEEKLAPYAHSLLINFRIPLTQLSAEVQISNVEFVHFRNSREGST